MKPVKSGKRGSTVDTVSLSTEMRSLKQLKTSHAIANKMKPSKKRTAEVAALDADVGVQIECLEDAVADDMEDQEGAPEEGVVDPESALVGKSAVSKTWKFGKFTFSQVDRVIKRGKLKGCTKHELFVVCPYHEDPGDVLTTTRCTETASYKTPAERVLVEN